MIISEFYNLYDLKDANILELVYKDNTLILKVEFPIYMEYMANGFRTDFDFNYKYQIIFSKVKGNYTTSPYLINKYELIDNCLNITINNIDYLIEDNVTIKRV